MPNKEKRPSESSKLLIVSTDKVRSPSGNSIVRSPLPRLQRSSLVQENLVAKIRNIEHVKISDINELTLKYQIGVQIGKGSFGIVLEVMDKFSEKVWAMKIIEKGKRKGAKLKALEREIQILKMVCHPHIIYLHKIYESNEKIYLVLELCIGELTKLMNEKKVLMESEARKLVRDIISAVAYLHKNDIVHRDLKLENILLAQNPHDPRDKSYIKISDFGLSIIKGGHTLESMLHDVCGTLSYMSPEVILHRSYSHQCDVWSAGIIVHIMVTGSFPFKSDNDRDLEKAVCHEELEIQNGMLSPEAIDLLTKMLRKNPAGRITAKEALHHPWVEGKTLMQKKSPNNILDMMKMWKAELATPQTESDQYLYNLPSIIKKLGTGSNEDVSRTLSRNYSKTKQQTKKSATIASCQSSDTSSLSKKSGKAKGSVFSSKHSSASPSNASGGNVYKPIRSNQEV